MIELKENESFYLYNLYYLKKKFDGDEEMLYIDGIPFFIQDIRGFCGKKVTVSSVKYHSDGSIDCVKLKEDHGKFDWSPLMFDLHDIKPLPVGTNVFYRQNRNPSRIMCIEGGKYYIEFKYPKPWMHDCDGKVPSGKGWVCRLEDLTPMSKNKNYPKKG